MDLLWLILIHLLAVDGNVSSGAYCQARYAPLTVPQLPPPLQAIFAAASISLSAFLLLATSVAGYLCCRLH